MKNIEIITKKLTLALALAGMLACLGAARAAAQAQPLKTPAEVEAELRKAQPAKSVEHDFVAIDEGMGTLLRIDERDPSKNWRVKTGLSQMRDMQLVGNGRLMISYDDGYAEFDLATGKMLKKYGGLVNVAGARREPDGSTLLTGVDLAGRKGVCVLRLDASDKITGCTVYPGDYVRLMRETAQGTYLLCNNTEIREASPDGKILRAFPVDGFKHAWKAVRLANGHMLVSAGYGAFMVELDEKGNVARKFAGKDDLPADFHPFFAAMFQVLPNGDIVLANWQGHGPQWHGASGVQLFEIAPSGKVVWQWSRSQLISSLQGILVLDGLDTARLYDERAGLQEPMDKTPPASAASNVFYVPEPSATENADECELVAAVEKLREAMIAADGPVLASLAGKNLLYCHSGGLVQNKAEFVNAIVQGHSVFVTLEQPNQIVRITGDTAVVHHDFNARTFDNGKPGEVRLGNLQVWKKINGQWKLIGRQAFKPH